MNNKNKVYHLEGGHLHDENGGRLLHEWPLLMSLLWRPSPSDRSTLAAKLLKASLPQNFFHIILSQKVVSGGDLKNGVMKAQRHF